MIENLLRMSVTGAAVICAVLVLRLLLRRTPKIFSYALWLIVLFRLLCPFSVALPVSVFNLFPGEVRTEMTIAGQLPERKHPDNGQALLTEGGAKPSGEMDEAVVEESAVPGSGASGISGVRVWMAKEFGGWKACFAIVWLAGVTAMLAYACVGAMRLHKRIGSASLDKDNVYLLEGVSSPFVAGVIRPRIYLPYGLGENERLYILLHEQTHIRRGDPFFRVLAYLALTLHWFNPLVWAAFFLSGRDMEMSCDEMVLRRFGMEIRCDYSDSLLAMAQGKGLVTGIPLAFGEGDTGKRIKNVLNYRKATVQVAVIGVMVVALALAALGSDPVEHVLADDLSDAIPEGDGGDTEDAAQAADEHGDGTDTLTMELLCQIIDKGELENCDFHAFSNGIYDALGDDALNYYVSFSFANEQGDYELGVSYMKEDDEGNAAGIPDAIYLTRQWDNEVLIVYNRDKRYGTGAPPTGAEIKAFLAADFDIMREISFDLPDGLTLEPYSADVGYAGGRLFSPMLGEGGDGTPQEWMASGMVSRYYQEGMLTWEDGDNGRQIGSVTDFYNHSGMEYEERMDDLAYPAVMMHGTHDLYTAPEMEELDKQGIAYELASDYWYLFIAREGDTYGYVVSLSQKSFSREDMEELAASVRLSDMETEEGPEKDEADNALIATLPVRTVSRSARCIDNYVAPDEEWEKTYGGELFFAEDCTFFINYSRNSMDAQEVSYTDFAEAVSQGGPVLNKPCVLEIHNDDKLIHSITLVSGRYMDGVTYVSMAGYGFFDGFFEDAAALYPEYYDENFKLVRTETMDLALAPGEETIEIYAGSVDACDQGEVNFRDKEGNMLYSCTVYAQGMCLVNLYAGTMSGTGETFILEVHLENRDTTGEYTYYVYSLGYGNGDCRQIAGSRIEWNRDSSLNYDANEMEIFFHDLGYYLSDSHLLAGTEWKEDGTMGIRTDAVCDADKLTYENFAPIME